MERMLCGIEQGQRFETTGEQAPPDNSDEHYESAVDLDRCEMEHQLRDFGFVSAGYWFVPLISLPSQMEKQKMSRKEMVATVLAAENQSKEKG